MTTVAHPPARLGDAELLKAAREILAPAPAATPAAGLSGFPAQPFLRARGAAIQAARLRGATWEDVRLWLLRATGRGLSRKSLRAMHSEALAADPAARVVAERLSSLLPEAHPQPPTLQPEAMLSEAVAIAKGEAPEPFSGSLMQWATPRAAALFAAKAVGVKWEAMAERYRVATGGTAERGSLRKIALTASATDPSVAALTAATIPLLRDATARPRQTGKELSFEIAAILAGSAGASPDPLWGAAGLVRARTRALGAARREGATWATVALWASATLGREVGEGAVKSAQSRFARKARKTPRKPGA